MTEDSVKLDANYRVVMLTDEDGYVVERTTYTAYGEPTLYGGLDSGTAAELGNALLVSTVGNPLMHQGLFHDRESLSYQNRFRQYDSRSGRFLQRDPLGYVDGMSLYEYLSSAVVDHVDPLGLDDWLTWGAKMFRKAREAVGGVYEVGPVAAYDGGVGASYQKSIDYSQKYKDQGPPDDPDGARNAARHANWQARLAYKHGADAAAKIGDIHEAGQDPDDADHQADVHNNVEGRKIGEEARDQGRPIDDIDDMVDEAMDDGRLIVDRSGDPRLSGSGKDPDDNRSDSPCSPDDSSPESNSLESPSEKGLL